MKKLLFIVILFASLNGFSQINLASYNSMFARIEVEEGWAVTDLFQLHFYSETWILEKEDSVYRSRPGFQANLVFITSHGGQVLALLRWFNPDTRLQADFKLWGQTATARCRVINTTHHNGIVNVKITGLETLKYK